MRVFAAIIFICLQLWLVYGANETTTPAPTTGADEEGSGGSGNGTTDTSPSTDGTTDTSPSTDSCGLCTLNEECPVGCDCEEGERSPNSICAEPCDPNYLWCSTGQECVVNKEAENGYDCACGAGFYDGDNGGCLSGKFYGGQMVIEGTVPDNDTEYNATKANIEEMIDIIYDGTDGFVRSEVLQLKKGSIIATYQLIFMSDADVDEEILYQAFNDSTNCSNNHYEMKLNDSTSLTIICDRTLESLIDDTILCLDPSTNPCDEETTNCTNPNGQFFCECIDGYGKDVEYAVSCKEFLCTDNGDCNSPFGICNKTATEEDSIDNKCVCDWGFSGDTCKEPWMFVFTIVTAGLGLILIIVVVVLVCNMTKTKAPKKTQSLEDLNLTNPFVDFQPGIVRAKVPSGLYSISDPLDPKEANGNTSSAKRNSYANGAYSHAYDSLHLPPKKASQNHYESTDLMAPGKSDGAEYF